MPGTQIIATKDLRAHHLPPLNADWNQISDFVLSFNPNDEIENWRFPFSAFPIDQTPNKDSSILEIRNYLYTQQRWWNNKTIEIDDASLNKIHQAIELLRTRLH